MARGARVVRSGYKGVSTAGSLTATKPHGRGPKKPPLTHFICLPLVTLTTRPQLELALENFRDIVRGHDANIPLDSIRPIGTIHFTLGVMSLTDVDRVSEAIGHLQTLDINSMIQEVVAEQGDLFERDTIGLGTMSLTALHAMQSPTKTSSLYAGPEDPSKRLLPLCLRIRDAFASAGFIVMEDRPLKLHATILNTIYAKSGGRNKAPSPDKDNTTLPLTHSNEVLPASLVRDISPPGGAPLPDSSRGRGRRSRAPITLDATQLLDKCKDFIWASGFAIEKLAICEMGAKKILDMDGNIVDEQYEEVASIALPV